MLRLRIGVPGAECGSASAGACISDCPSNGLSPSDITSESKGQQRPTHPVTGL
jgi:hypothetical protein